MSIIADLAGSVNYPNTQHTIELQSISYAKQRKKSSNVYNGVLSEKIMFFFFTIPSSP
jgi:hypothetical protein